MFWTIRSAKADNTSPTSRLGYATLRIESSGTSIMRCIGSSSSEYGAPWYEVMLEQDAYGDSAQRQPVGHRTGTRRPAVRICPPPGVHSPCSLLQSGCSVVVPREQNGWDVAALNRVGAVGAHSIFADTRARISNLRIVSVPWIIGQRSHPTEGVVEHQCLREVDEDLCDIAARQSRNAREGARAHLRSSRAVLEERLDLRSMTGAAASRCF
eukprot:7383108-Prymnesium_polylepis.1